MANINTRITKSQPFDIAFSVEIIFFSFLSFFLFLSLIFFLSFFLSLSFSFFCFLSLFSSLSYCFFLTLFYFSFDSFLSFFSFLTLFFSPSSPSERQNFQIALNVAFTTVKLHLFCSSFCVFFSIVAFLKFFNFCLTTINLRNLKPFLVTERSFSVEV